MDTDATRAQAQWPAIARVADIDSAKVGSYCSDQAFHIPSR